MASAVQSDVKNDIVEYFQNHIEELNNFKDSIKDKDITIIFGNTRTGKSTLVNYLIGNPLKAIEDLLIKKEYKIQKENENDIGPQIGQGSTSCTDFSTIYKVQDGNNEYLIDSPGFEDTRGITQDIANAFCINQIQYAKSAKFVVVFDISDLTSDNIRQFTKTLEYIQRLITNFDKLKSSFCLIFTKDANEYTQEDIINILKTKILNVEGLNFNKSLVSNIVADKRYIGIFRMPTNIGVILNSLDINVKDALKHTRFIDIEKCEIKFSVSDKTNETLLGLYPEYIDSAYFESELAKTKQEVSDYFEVEKFVYASYDNELTETLEVVSEIQNIIEEESRKEIDTPAQVQDSINSILNGSIARDFTINFNFIVVMDDSKLLEENYRTMITENYKTSLNDIKEEFSNLIQKIRAEQSTRSNSNIVFIAASVGGVLASIPMGATLSTAVGRMCTTGGVVQTICSPGTGVFAAMEGVIGVTAATAAGVIGAGVVGVAAGALYVTYRELYTKRIEERNQQGRE